MNPSRLVSRLLWTAAFAVVTLLSLPFNTSYRSTTAEACWNNQLIECFDSTRIAWPWCKPTGSGRCWRFSPNPPAPFAWGVQDRNYSVRIQSYCGNDDDQSLWIIGEPGTEDPDFDNYPGNLNTFVTYGPLDLTGAAEARVLFSLLMYNGMDPQDTLCWGADSVFSLATTHIWIDSVFSGQTDQGWELFEIDLKDLYRNVPTRDSVSALGRPAVYIYWWFRSDADAIRDRGAFIDDIIVSIDNGTVDLQLGGMSVVNTDSFTVPSRIETGDSVLARMTWAACDGGVLFYPDFHAQLFLDGVIVFDSVVTGVEPGTTETWYTEPIAMNEAGDHSFQFVIDALDEVAENNEGNNSTAYPFTVFPPNEPPTFEWITPVSDTLEGVGFARLRWSLTDPDDDAYVTIHVDPDNEGCVGPIVPGTLNRPEVGLDSVDWTMSGLPVGAVRWLYAEYGDNLFLGCEYSPFPVVVGTTDADGHQELIPITFALNQNYPNPFNPATTINFSITRAGHTTLKVFDITGREVATLIDNDLTPGLYDAGFHGASLPSGVYIYRLDAPEGNLTRKMILMK